MAQQLAHPPGGATDIAAAVEIEDHPILARINRQGPDAAQRAKAIVAITNALRFAAQIAPAVMLIAEQRQGIDAAARIFRCLLAPPKIQISQLFRLTAGHGHPLPLACCAASTGHIPPRFG